jgi:hypothetical protein
MAVKFSAFTNQAIDTDLTRIVGYKSGTNTQYTVAQLAAGILAADSGFTLGSVIFTGESGVLSQDNSNFFWDNTLNRLGIGTTEPGASIETTGNIIVGDTKSIGRSNSSGPNIEFIDTTGEENPQQINFRFAGIDIAGCYGQRFGIGTTTPSTKLHVIDAGYPQQMWGYDAASYTTLTVADDSHTTLATAETGDIILDSAGNITLDADSGIIKFQDGGADLANITTLRTESFIVACSDETTALTVGTKATLRMPYAFTLTAVRASLTTAGTTSGLTTIDINLGGSSIFTTNLLTIDFGDKTSVGATTAPNITTTALTSDGEITVDVDGLSGGATEAGLKVTLIGYQTV